MKFFEKYLTIGTQPSKAEQLSPFGQLLLLDRYAQKDPQREYKKGDLAIVCPNPETKAREIATFVRYAEKGKITVELEDGSQATFPIKETDRPIEKTAAEVLNRMAKGFASAESENQDKWEGVFREALGGFKFVPGGRVWAQCGTNQKLSFYNCFVIPSPHDSRQGLMDSLSQMTEIMSRGGGVGMTLSSLRPRMAYVKGVNGRSSGSVSWGSLFSFVTGLIEQGGSRRGALMLILEAWHPDVIEFIHSKRTAGKITNANISVGISNDFMEAVQNDELWTFEFPDTEFVHYDEEWNGDLKLWKENGYPVIEYDTKPAREIWEEIIESAWDSAEPGLWFKDRANEDSNSYYYAPLISCNPCAEEPLPGYGVCNLGSLNLPKFLRSEFPALEWENLEGRTSEERIEMAIKAIDWAKLRKTVHVATRALDNIIDLHEYFIEDNAEQQLGERRVGLGTLGVADLLIRVGLRYGSPESLELIDKLYKNIAVYAYEASIELAEERGAFPEYKADFVNSGFMKKMPEEIKQAVLSKGIRNVTLLTQPPTGTTGSMMETSTGIEPFFYEKFDRKSRVGFHTIYSRPFGEWREKFGQDKELPEFFVTAMDLSPEDHVHVLAAIQQWTDAACSKTCNVPNDYTVEQLAELYELMFSLGCKGGTVYRDGSRNEQVLHINEDDKEEEEKEDPVPTSVSKKSEGFLKDRPQIRSGETLSIQLPMNRSAHVTINSDENGDPIEVFVNAGKVGSDVAVMAEALGRVCSMFLRVQNDPNGSERLEILRDQLRGLQGSHSIGFGERRVRSLPDGIGFGIELFLKGKEGENVEEEVKEVVNNANENLQFTGDTCPECHNTTLVKRGTCEECINCGYSRC